MSDEDYQVQVIKSINEIAPDKWNTLSTSCYTDYYWFKTIEDSNILDIKLRHIMIFNNDKIIAICASYIQYEGFMEQ